MARCIHCSSTSARELTAQSTSSATVYQCKSCNKVFSEPTLFGKHPWLLSLGIAALTGGVSGYTGHLLGNGGHGPTDPGLGHDGGHAFNL